MFFYKFFLLNKLLFAKMGAIFFFFCFLNLAFKLLKFLIKVNKLSFRNIFHIIKLVKINIIKALWIFRMDLIVNKVLNII